MTKTSKTVQKHIGLEGINERIMTIRIPWTDYPQISVIKVCTRTLNTEDEVKYSPAYRHL